MNKEITDKIKGLVMDGEVIKHSDDFRYNISSFKIGDIIASKRRYGLFSAYTIRVKSVEILNLSYFSRFVIYHYIERLYKNSYKYRSSLNEVKEYLNK